MKQFLSNVILISVVCIFSMGFSKKHEEHIEYQGKQVVVTEAGQDILIPTELWKMLEDEKYRPIGQMIDQKTNDHDQHEPKKVQEHDEHASKDEHSEGSDTGNLSRIDDVSVQFIPLKVTFTEKNPGVLKEPSIQYVLPNGGGHIDLSKLTTGANGSFYVKVEIEIDPKDSPSYWFISRSKKRRIDQEVWGGGCNTFYNLDKFVPLQMFSGEFLVNTTRDRHITLLGGTFLFASRKSRDLKIAHLTFSDTTKDRLFCENRAN